MTFHIDDIIKRINTATAEEFLDRVRRSNEAWWVGGHLPWVFRGQWDASWELLPAAFRRRKENRLRPLIQQSLHNFHPGTSPYGELRAKAQYFAETEALCQFCELARDARIVSVPSPVHPARRGGAQIAMYRDHFFPREDRTYDHWCPDLRAAPIAQHHGVPTRLLDFSIDPLLATYFAICPSLRPPNVVPTHTALWAIDTSNWLLSEFLRDVVVIDALDGVTGADDYIDAQGGCFVLIKQAANYYMNHAKWPSLEDAIRSLQVQLAEQNADAERWPKVLSRSPSPFPLLIKITLPTTEVPRLLRVLERERISVAHLMPTLDNVSRTLRDRWQSM
jgi:hypothetical protein